MVRTSECFKERNGHTVCADEPDEASDWHVKYNLPELRARAKRCGVRRFSKMYRAELIKALEEVL